MTNQDNNNIIDIMRKIENTRKNPDGSITIKLPKEDKRGLVALVEGAGLREVLGSKNK